MEKNSNWKVAALKAANNFNGEELAFQVTEEQGKYLRNHYDVLHKWCEKTLNKNPHTIMVQGNEALLCFDEGEKRALSDVQRELAIRVVDELIDIITRNANENVKLRDKDEIIKNLDDLENLDDVRMEIESEDDEFESEWLRFNVELNYFSDLEKDEYNEYIKNLVEDVAKRFYYIKSKSNDKQIPNIRENALLLQGKEYEEKDMLTVIDYFSWYYQL